MGNRQLTHRECHSCFRTSHRCSFLWRARQRHDG